MVLALQLKENAHDEDQWEQHANGGKNITGK
jgi:hypothetical protein